MTLRASPRRLATPVKLASAAVATLGAGLLTAACSGPSAHPRADSQPGASRISATAGSSAHAAPVGARTTTPGAGPSSPSAPPPAPAPTPTPAPSTTGVAGPAPLARCSTPALRISLGSANGAAGSIYYPLDFTNISGAACSMYGYPGVSFVSARGGREVGGPAVRNSTFRPSLVALAPGAVAHASVQVQVAQNYPTSLCKPVTAHWLRIYPPDQYTPLYAGLTALTCTGSIPGGSTLGIYVVRPGANGP